MIANVELEVRADHSAVLKFEQYSGVVAESRRLTAADVLALAAYMKAKGEVMLEIDKEYERGRAELLR